MSNDTEKRVSNLRFARKTPPDCVLCLVRSLGQNLPIQAHEIKHSGVPRLTAMNSEIIATTAEPNSTLVSRSGTARCMIRVHFRGSGPVLQVQFRGCESGSTDQNPHLVHLCQET